MDVEIGLKCLDDLSFEKKGKHLSDLERKIFEETWQDGEDKKTFEQIASSCNCNDSYVKKIWTNWWNLLSKELEEDVNRSNYKGALERLKRNNTNAKQSKIMEKKVSVSDFYVERPPVEERCYQEILKPGNLIRIKAPQKMGKTLLLEKVLDYARKQGYQTVKLDFRQADTSVLVNYETFLKWLCFYVSDSLEIDDKTDEYWKKIAGLNNNCTLYFQKYLLDVIKSDLVLALDNFEVLFKCKETFQDFCSLLRSWHEKSKAGDRVGQIWKKLRLIIVNSTESYPKLDDNRSPFNVGVPIELNEFTQQQIENLLRHYQLDKKIGEHDLESLVELVGGHPYLITEAFVALKNEQNTIKNLLIKASTQEGIFSDHLRRELQNLRHYKLQEAYKKVVTANKPVTLDPELGFKLHSLGLIKFCDNDCVPSCNLYRLYFSAHLGDSQAGE